MNSTTNTVMNIVHPQFTMTNHANSHPFLATQSKINHETEETVIVTHHDDVVATIGEKNSNLGDTQAKI